MAKRVVPMDSPGRQLLVSRSLEPFDFSFMLAWLLGQACLASKSLGLNRENMGEIGKIERMAIHTLWLLGYCSDGKTGCTYG